MLPPAVLARVAVEAGVPLGWDRYVGPFGAVVGVAGRFGASAPVKVVMERYGFTAQNVADKALAGEGRRGRAARGDGPPLGLTRTAMSWLRPGALALGVLISASELIAAEPAPEWPAPTAETRPWTRWWWLGSAVDETNLTRQLELFRAAGIGGVEICPIYGVQGGEDRDVPFLSPRFMELLGTRSARRSGSGSASTSRPEPAGRSAARGSATRTRRRGSSSLAARSATASSTRRCRSGRRATSSRSRTPASASS